MPQQAAMDEARRRREENNPPATLLGVVPVRTQQHYHLQSGVVLSDSTRSTINSIANIYNEATNKSITVTSGNRSPNGQASAMYTKLERGDNILSLYTNTSAAIEVKKAYDKGVASGRSRNMIISDMSEILQRQISGGVYISKHLLSSAADISVRGMTNDDKRAFISAAESAGMRVIDENDHFHIQIK